MRSALVALLFVISGCGVVRHSSIRDDYAASDRTQTIRVRVITAPLPAGDATLGQMWSKIAQRYVNHHRDFIALEPTAAEALPADACHDTLEGVLVIAPKLERSGAGAEAEAQARLFRCRDGSEVWSAEAGGSWPSQDEQVSQVIREYREEFGPAVEPFVAPSFHLLRALLDTLPYPKMPNDEYVMEKIELVE